MKRVLSALGLLAVLLSICSCQQQYAVSTFIYQFKLTNDSVQLVSDTPIVQPLSITVSYEVTDENDAVSTVILADGQLIDGKLELTQRVTEPTEVEILVRTDNMRLRHENFATTVLRPTSEIGFVVIHKVSSHLNRPVVLFKGNDHRSLHENSRFSIKGNLNQVPHLNLHLLRVSIKATPSLVDGSGDTITFGPVLVDGGEFSVEGDLDVPTLFTITLTRGTVHLSEFDRVHAILEPGFNYRVVPIGTQGRFAVLADQDSLHTQLVSSWQLDPEFIALVDTLVDRKLDMRWGMETEAIEHHEQEQVRIYQVSEKCAHVSLADDVKSQFIEPFRYSYQKTNDQLVTIRSEALRNVLRDTQNSELVRIIFELIWRQMEVERIYSDHFSHELVMTLPELERKLDQEYIDQFITPRVEFLTKHKRMKLRYGSLRPGQVAPQFTLPTIAGDEVSLSEVLRKNELVFVDFWASWCDQCTRSFPVLKNLYSTYKNQGFEIVTISIDDSTEAWKAYSKAYELPWIDLGDTQDGEMKDGSSSTADDYGVRWSHVHMFRMFRYGNQLGGERVTSENILNGSQRRIPNRFLIDKKGCIVHKQFSDGELQNLLTSLLVGSS